MSSSNEQSTTTRILQLELSIVFALSFFLEGPKSSLFATFSARLCFLFCLSADLI